MTNNQQHLLDFFESYIKWINDGAGKHQVFDRRHGLCNMLERWVAFHNHDWELTHVLSMKIGNYVGNLVRSEENEECTFAYPFGGKSDYRFAMETNTQHENSLRLAWVNQQIRELQCLKKSSMA